MTDTRTHNGCSAIEVREPSTVGEAVIRREDQAKTSELTYRPSMDLYELNDRYELHFDLPGTTSDLIDVTVHDSVLTVEARVPDRYGDRISPVMGEYGVGDFRRRVRLGEDVDSEQLSARYADGVLMLTLPKRAEWQPRRIPISSG